MQGQWLTHSCGVMLWRYDTEIYSGVKKNVGLREQSLNISQLHWEAPLQIDGIHIHYSVSSGLGEPELQSQKVKKKGGKNIIKSRQGHVNKTHLEGILFEHHIYYTMCEKQIELTTGFEGLLWLCEYELPPSGQPALIRLSEKATLMAIKSTMHSVSHFSIAWKWVWVKRQVVRNSCT